MRSRTEKPGYLDGQLLIAMPSMSDPRFAHSVVYLCAHSAAGAMGLVVNRRADHISFSELLEHLDIEKPAATRDPAVHIGGPVDSDRGFVLHSIDYRTPESTLQIDDDVGLTATIDILKAIARGEGPQRAILALGYAGWAPGQLESEIQDNGWLNCSADTQILFGDDNDVKWDLALSKLGVSASQLSSTAGRA